MAGFTLPRMKYRTRRWFPLIGLMAVIVLLYLMLASGGSKQSIKDRVSQGWSNVRAGGSAGGSSSSSGSIDVIQPHAAHTATPVNGYPKLQLERIGFAINTGGPKPSTHNAEIKQLVESLQSYGVHRYDIFVFDDDGPRGYQPDPELVTLVSTLGIRLKYSHIPKQDDPAGLADYHESKHYHFVLDTLLQPHMNDVIDGREVTTHGYDFGVVFNENALITPALPNYFNAISNLMLKDPTIHIASAINLNSVEGTVTSIDELPVLPYRRTNHFVSNHAFMMSAKAYNTVLRPRWMSEGSKGWIPVDPTNQKLPNGQWTTFMDSQITIDSEFNVVYPAISLVQHQNSYPMGDAGYKYMLATHETAIQQELVERIERQTFEDDIRTVVQSCDIVFNVQALKLYRNSLVCMMVPAEHDADPVWHIVLGQTLGLRGMEGDSPFQRQRNVYRGIVIQEYLTNTVLFVGKYSRFMDSIRSKLSITEQPYALGALSPAYYTDTLKYTSRLDQDQVVLFNRNLKSSYVGCFTDKQGARDLSYFAEYLSEHLSPFKKNWNFEYPRIQPSRCIATCQALGFEYAGVQWASECYCGHAYGSLGEDTTAGACGATCVENSVVPNEMLAQSMFKHPCGGALKNSVYKTHTQPTASVAMSTAHRNVKLSTPTSDAQIILGAGSISCTQACQAKGLQCSAQHLPLINNDCQTMKSLSGCTECKKDAMSSVDYSPSFDSTTKVCTNGRTLFNNCGSVPATNAQRFCTCTSRQSGAQ